MLSISPRLLKGAIISLDPNRSEVLRLKRPLIETIKCSIEIDATDQVKRPGFLGEGDAVTIAWRFEELRETDE